MKWNTRDDVAQLYLLLQEWKQVDTQTSLELLDCKYADLRVRARAVMWLDNTLSDEVSEYFPPFSFAILCAFHRSWASTCCSWCRP